MIQPPTNNEVQRSPTDNSYKNSRNEITQPPTSNILSSWTDNVNSRTHGVQTTSEDMQSNRTDNESSRSDSSSESKRETRLPRRLAEDYVMG